LILDITYRFKTLFSPNFRLVGYDYLLREENKRQKFRLCATGNLNEGYLASGDKSPLAKNKERPTFFSLLDKRKF